MKITLKEVLLLILVLFGFIMFTLYNVTKTPKVKDNKYQNSGVLVKNSTEYYTISGIVDKYVQMLSEKSADKLFAVLDLEYKNKSNITKNNILKKVEDLSNGRYTFSGNQMYSKRVNDRIKKYYVSGEILIQTFDTEEKYKDFYVVIKQDKKNNTFSIIPDDGTLFKEVSQWKLS